MSSTVRKRMKYESIAIVVPAYNPDTRLAELVRRLLPEFGAVIVVDDGSTAGKDAIEAAARDSAIVLRHPANRGKGAALKTAFRHILENMPGVEGVVTADADGQHLPEDIEKTAAALAGSGGARLVLGVRAFSGDVPLRSRIGNDTMRLVFRLMTGIAVTDTQTGLRGIPRSLLPRLLELDGDRYEYEIQMLADARFHAAPPLQVPIETVYVENNATSHFRPLADSAKVFGALFHACGVDQFVHFAGSGFGAFLLDNAIFAATMAILPRLAPGIPEQAHIPAAFCAARFASANANYQYNRRRVFKSGGGCRQFAQYWLLVAVVALLSCCGTMALEAVARLGGALVTFLKIGVDCFLFLLSYNVQRGIIFKNPRRTRR